MKSIFWDDDLKYIFRKRQCRRDPAVLNVEIQLSQKFNFFHSGDHDDHISIFDLEFHSITSHLICIVMIYPIEIKNYFMIISWKDLMMKFLHSAIKYRWLFEISSIHFSQSLLELWKKFVFIRSYSLKDSVNISMMIRIIRSIIWLSSLSE